MLSPTISVIIPNYNHARFLEHRIESVLNQTYQDFELILLDDASTDNSLELFRNYQDHPKAYKTIINNKNSGSPFLQWQKGIEASRGKYLWIAETDDLASPTFLEELEQVMSNDSSISLIFSDSIKIDQDGKPLGEVSKDLAHFHPDKWQNSYKESGYDEICNYFWRSCIVQNVSSALIRKSDIDFDTEFTRYRRTGDWIFYTNLIKNKHIYFVNKPLNYFRISPKDFEKNKLIHLEKIETRYSILREIKQLKEKRSEFIDATVYDILNLKEKKPALIFYSFLKILSIDLGFSFRFLMTFRRHLNYIF